MGPYLPVPFCRLDEEEQYRKFDWLECRLVRNQSDPRPETFRPVDENALKPIGHVGIADKWRERRRILLQTARVYDRLDELIAGAKANQVSLAVFKPTRIIAFIWEEETREWDRGKLQEMRKLTNQLDLFSDNSWRETFQVIPKLSYEFKKDLHFFLGTTQQFHSVAPNPWVIIGVFPIPYEHQLRLF